MYIIIYIETIYIYIIYIISLFKHHKPSPDVTIRIFQVAGGTSFGSDASGGAVGTGHWTIPAALVRGHQSDPQPGPAANIGIIGTGDHQN